MNRRRYLSLVFFAGLFLSLFCSADSVAGDSHSFDSVCGLSEAGSRRLFLSCLRERDSVERFVGTDKADSVFDAEIWRIIDLLMGKSAGYEAIGFVGECISYYDSIDRVSGNRADSAGRKKSVLRRLSLDIVLGAAYEEVGLRSVAMELYRNGLRLAEESGSREKKALLYNNMANIYFRMQDFPKAERYWKKAVEINREIGERKELVNNFNNLAGLYYMQGDYPKVLDLLYMAQEVFPKEEDPDSYYLLRYNFAQTYMQMGEILVAKKILGEAYRYFSESGKELNWAQAATSLSEIFLSEGMRDSALHYAREGADMSQRMRNIPVSLSSLDQFYKVLVSSGLYEEACNVSDIRTLLRDSLYEMDVRRQLSTMESLYELERSGKNRELLIRELNIKNLEWQKMMLFLLVCILLVIAVSVYVFLKYRSTARLKRAGEVLFEQQKALHEKDRQMARRREQELLDSLELKNKELTSKVLFLIKNNEFVMEMGKELQELMQEMKPRDEKAREKIRSLIVRLRNQSNEETFSEFQYYFEQVHQSFYKNLKDEYPVLTSRDLRFCAFLRLGLTTKEISTISFREVRSVESSRNRLRKKLGLQPSEDIVAFLSRF